MMNTPAIKNFEIKELIATGGMASVYKAMQISLERTVALKILHIHLAQDANFITRFKREAKAAANLNHENIVTIIDYGEADGAYFIAMEYVEGKSLEWVIAALKRLPLDIACAVAYEICQGLNHAHQKGVVHRDIKPANILIGYDGLAKIADFGVAQAQNFTSLTITGSMVGTPAYMSPEQAACKKVDHRSDIFSLGVVMYEMIAGIRPFSGDNYTVLICEIMTATPTPLNEINPAIPPEVGAIIGKMLEKDVDKRYGAIAEVGRDIVLYFHRKNYELSRKEIAGLVIAPDEYLKYPPEKDAGHVPSAADRTINEVEKDLAGIRTGAPFDELKQKELQERKKPSAVSRKSTLRLSVIIAASAIAALTIFSWLFLKRPGPKEATFATEAVKKIGIAVVNSTPEGAAVAIDDKKTGLFTPVRLDSLSAGEHTVKLEKAGYTSLARKVTIKGGDSAYLALSLEKEPPSEVKTVPRISRAKTAKAPPPQNAVSFFKIKVDPWAEIYIGNKHIETTPVASPLRIPSGTHVVELGNPNFKSWRRTISFKPGDTVDLDVQLEPPDGSLKLVVKPWADVYIDGKFCETTPIAEPIRLSAGKHSLKLINPTFKVHEEQIDISANNVTKKNVELQTK